MMKRPALFLLILSLLPSSLMAAASDVAMDRLFAQKVYPLLKSKCLACHGDDPKKIKADLNMLTRDAMLKGGESGDPALIPGKAENSLIYISVTWTDPDLEMPPKKNDRLNDEQMALLKQWINAGAPWPDDARRQELQAEAWKTTTGEGHALATLAGQSPEWINRRYSEEDLWSFLPPKKVSPPWNALSSKQPRHPVDAFIQAELNEKQITPAPSADKHTLIRRATYDLTGLPPTPEEIQAFVTDQRPDAWEKLIDRLLASPRYGEKWASHWLDVVRYADSSGFANDYPRPHAWRYRDYVIRAFNQDKPYDQFVREQIAGDEIRPDDPEMLIAVGFLRTGPWEHTGMSVAAVTRQQFLDDVTNNVGVSFLGFELRCAQCHDHKFDPIPTRDYYRIQAAFAPVQFADRKVPWLKTENIFGFEEGRTRAEQLKQKSNNIRSLKTIPKSEWPVENYDAEAEKKGHARVNKKRHDYIDREISKYDAYAFSIYNGPDRTISSNQTLMAMPPENKRNGQAGTVHILKGGSLESPTDPVTPGALSAVAAIRGAENPDAAANLPETLDGRRKALAEWITSTDNPLTARVMVNRIWLYHFGRAIAGNPNNLGKTGQKPSHPQLLDHLAQTFVEQGWSIKAMHRLIMTSEAYKRSSDPLPKEMAEKDPGNLLWARFDVRRLTAEEIRDSMLALSGELNLTMGGIPARPEINLEVAMQPRQIMGGIAMAYQPDPKPAQRHRRTIYTERTRTLRDPQLEVFNQPSLDLSCEARDASTVTPQVFSLFNSRHSYDRSLAMARRLENLSDSISGRIDRAFELVHGRRPTDAERQQSMDHVKTMTAHHAAHPPQKVTPPKYVIREMVDEQTGVTFYWVEDLDIYQGPYVPDLKPWDVGPETRALADLCLVLFNSNEFVYVY